MTIQGRKKSEKKIQQFREEEKIQKVYKYKTIDFNLGSKKMQKPFSSYQLGKKYRVWSGQGETANLAQSTQSPGSAAW